jgi:two-component system, chemotaxis family, CheB/CheR fusion protein
MPDRKSETNAPVAGGPDQEGIGDGVRRVLSRLRFLERIEEQETRQRLLAAIVEASRDAIWSWDLAGTITSWNAEAERLLGYSPDEIIGRSILALIPADRQDIAQTAIADLREGNWYTQYETARVHRNGSLVEVEVTVSPIRDEIGEIIGAATISREITDRKQAQAHAELLRRELDHRVKNTLSTVLALVHQTARTASTTSEYVADLEARLMSLLQAHEALRESDSGQVSLYTIAERELRPFSSPDRAIEISGDEVWLDWTAARMIALAIHELGANAARHGALRAENGTVRLSWRREAGAARQVVRLEWQEAAQSIVSEPGRRGFGLTLLERGLPRVLGAEATLSFSPGGMRYSLVFPEPSGPPSAPGK